MSKVLHPPFPSRPKSGDPSAASARDGRVRFEWPEPITEWNLSPEDARKWGDRLLTFAETAEEQADG
jgi:hypothetical protein